VKDVTGNWRDIYKVEFCTLYDPAGVVIVLILYGGLLGKQRSAAEMFWGALIDK
jgi:hypothetical protein